MGKKKLSEHQKQLRKKAKNEKRRISDESIVGSDPIANSADLSLPHLPVSPVLGHSHQHRNDEAMNVVQGDHANISHTGSLAHADPLPAYSYTSGSRVPGSRLSTASSSHRRLLSPNWTSDSSLHQRETSSAKRQSHEQRPVVKARRPLFTHDICDPVHRHESEDFLAGESIRSKKGRQKYVLSKRIAERQREKQRYHERRDKIRTQKAARYRSSPAFKARANTTSLARYKSLCKDRTKDSHYRNVVRKAQNERFQKSPRTHRKWLEYNRRRQRSPSKRKAINKTRRQSYQRSPGTHGRNRLNVLRRVQHHRDKVIQKAKVNMLKRKYQDLKLQRIARYGKQRMQRGESEFINWAYVRLMKSYLAGVTRAHSVRLSRHRHFVFRCLDGVMILRRKMLRDMARLLDSLHETWADLELRVNTLSSSEKDGVLEQQYGGLRYHVATGEQYGLDRETKQYSDLNQFLAGAFCEDTENEADEFTDAGRHQQDVITAALALLPQQHAAAAEAGCHQQDVTTAALALLPQQHAAAAEAGRHQQDVTTAALALLPQQHAAAAEVGRHQQDVITAALALLPQQHAAAAEAGCHQQDVTTAALALLPQQHAAAAEAGRHQQDVTTAALALLPQQHAAAAEVGRHQQDVTTAALALLPQQHAVAAEAGRHQQDVITAALALLPQQHAAAAEAGRHQQDVTTAALALLPQQHAVAADAGRHHQDVTTGESALTQQHAATADAGRHQQGGVDAARPASAEVLKCKSWKNKMRHCDSNCSVPTKWASKLHRVIRLLTESGSYNQRLSNVMQFEKCDLCRSGTGAACPCSDLDQCQDNLRVLRQAISPHFVGARNLQRKLYRIRQLAMWILQFESVVFQGDYELFMQFIRERTRLLSKTVPQPSADGVLALSRDHMEQEAEERFGAFGVAWKEALRDYPTNPCAFCQRLFEKKKLHIGMKETSKQLRSENYHPRVVQFLESGKLKFPCDLCDRCVKDMSAGIVPRYSELNDMGVDEVPEELACLSYFGRLLLQLQKSFLSVFRLKPYRFRGPIAHLTKAVRGCVVHLPLPRSTMPATLAQLPATDNLSIVVDSLPTSKKIVWRNLINIDEWKRGLQKMKEINPFYKNVTVNHAIFEEDVPAAVESGEIGSKTVAEDGPDSLLRRVSANESYDEFTVQPVSQKIPNTSDIDLFAMKRVTAEPVSETEVNRDMLSYPYLFPRGRGGMLVDRRSGGKDGKTHVGPADFIKARLAHADSRFRRDTQWMFDMHHLKDFRAVDSGIYATINRHKAGERLTAAQFKDKIDKKHDDLEKNLYTMMSKVKGTKEYWSSVRSDFECMDAALGPCTFFVTLSCSEYDSEDFREFLVQRNHDIPDVDEVTTSSLCVNDPVSVALHFHRRFDLFMKFVILQPQGPLGTVKDYAWRMEYQARGLPHIHMKLWIDGAPVHGRDSPEKVIAFINQYITCALPDPTTSPRLHRLVSTKQKHTCGANCYRKAFAKFSQSKGAEQFVTRCRAGYPRTASSETTVNTLEESLRTRVSGKKVVKLYTLARRPCEIYINDYNPILLLLWGANMDIQYIGESSSVLNFYITNYIAKAEKNATDAVWAAVDKAKTDRGQLKSFAYKSFSSREVPAPEAAAKLLALPLFDMSSTIEWLGVGKVEDRRRSLKKMKDIQELGDDDTDLFHDNWVETYYPLRDDSLQDVSLHDMVSGYRVQKFDPHKEIPDKWKKEPMLKNRKGCFIKKQKGKESLIKYPKLNPHVSAANREKYFHNLLMLFKPWRDESELLLDGCTTYEESFRLVIADPAFERLKTVYRAHEDLEQAKKYAAEIEQKALAERQRVSEEQGAEDAVHGGLDGANTFMSMPVAIISSDSLQRKISSLNQVQKDVFDHVVKAVEHRETHRSTKQACICPGVNSLVFVSGVGGTGKSHVIHSIVDKVSHDYGPNSVAVAAPTGIAALNIAGMTLHRLLKLPIQHGKDAEYWALPKADVKALRAFFSQVRVFIVDEISMVSNVVLAYCHARLSELFGIDDGCLPFGGVMLLVFGDLLQLPPVNSQFCFEPLDRSTIRRVFGGVDVGCNLWREFSYFELTQNMRQQDDLEFAELLNRARIGCPSDGDIQKLQGRVVYIDSHGIFFTGDCIPAGDKGSYRDLTLNEAAKYLLQLIDQEKQTLAILPKNATTDFLNAEVLKLLGMDLLTILAEDNIHGNVSKRMLANRSRKKIKKASDTGGLEEKLIVAKGCRLMIRRNIDPEKRLMNGSLGTLLDFEFVAARDGTPLVKALIVAIDGVKTPVKLERVQVRFHLSKNVTITRHQFPVIVAYAITDHKSQALSLKCVMLDLGPDCFASGMAYVALSRCVRLSMVHLIRFDPDVIRCTSSCVHEYNRLRASSIHQCLPQFKDHNLNVKPGRKRRSRVAIEPLLAAEIRSHDDQPLVKKCRPNSVHSVQPDHSVQLESLPIEFALTQNPQSRSCYANCIVQCLFQLGDHFWSRLAAFGENEACRALLALWQTYQSDKTSRLDTDTLRTLLGFDLAEQDDAGSFLNILLQRFPMEVKMFFDHYKATVAKCAVCNRWSDTLSVEESLVWEADVQGTQQFVDVMSGNSTRRAFCPHCLGNTDQLVANVPLFQRDRQNFFVQLNSFRQVSAAHVPVNFKIQGLNSSGVTIGRHSAIAGCVGKTFRPLCIVEHEGETHNFGHYMTWIKRNAVWYQISDDRLRSQSKTIVRPLKKAYIVLMTTE